MAPAASPPLSPHWSQSPPDLGKPGVIPLRPLGVTEILDGSISTMRRHLRPTLGVSAIVVTVSRLLILAATYPLLDDLNRAVQFDENTPTSVYYDFLGKGLAVAGLTLLITLLAQVFLSGFLTVVIGKAVLGQPVGFGEVWGRVRPRLPALLGLTLVYPAIAVGVGAVLFVLLLIAPPLAILLLLAAIPFAVWLYILFSLATPALMLENASVGRAFGRSRQLVRGKWWRIFGVTLLAGIITAIMAAIITVPFTFFGGGFGRLTSTTPVAPTATYLVLTTIGGIIAGTLTAPFAAGVLVLLYTDQRMRREGMDIELARAAGQAPA
ncbi:MAG: hypothetical protein ACJ72N_17120 [Labedaea sp.]